MTSAADGQLSKAYQATAQAVGSARHAVSEFALAMGVDPGRVNAIAVAVGEACSNVVVHAYRDSSTPGEMVVAASVLDGDLTVQVIDYGVGMIPRFDSPGIGMGVPLMSQLADAFESKTSARDGTEVCMRFSLQRGEAPCHWAPEPALEGR